MKSNAELQKDVQDALLWEPLLRAAEIGVTVNDGLVTLSGTVDSYTKKIEAEDAAKNVAGVRAIIEKINVQFGHTGATTDEEIATAVLNAVKWNWEVPQDKVQVKVEKGWVTLSGELHWNYQKEAARTTIKNLKGIVGISNNITIQPEVQEDIDQQDIVNALRRNWTINDDDIHVKVDGRKVILSGTVLSWYQRSEAEKIAWNAPGVWMVDNELTVEYEYAM